MGGKHEESMVRGIEFLKVGGSGIPERVRHIIIGICPPIRIFLSVFQPLHEYLLDSALCPSQAPSRGMRDPIREQKVQHVANICFHVMKQTVEFLAVLFVKVGTHETLHNYCVNKDGNLLKDLNLRFLRPFRDIQLGRCGDDLGEVIQRHVAIDAPTQ